MSNSLTPSPFWVAIAGAAATLLFAWQAVAASSAGATQAGAVVGWIPAAYAIEAMAISLLIAIVLHPARMHERRSIDLAWIGFGALVTIGLMSAMTVGGALAPALVLAMAAAAVGTRKTNSGAGRAIGAAIVGAVLQGILMLLVIATAIRLSPRSS